VIGTHRLLQKTVRFRDLGLLVVDEEHRFGVAHKERIKQLKKTVDVLTLTATPIPRTLQLAFSGVRDLSVISTPPVDRIAIRTQITRFSESLCREAVLREVRRGGQVFFVHNRVQTIESIAALLRRIVPEVKLIVAHGQLRERELEKRMLAFLHGEADVLLCTTIIESGLDIPRANTILINRADTMGLAQLYQLRGRVGRSRHRAYAYLLLPDALTADAERSGASRRSRTSPSSGADSAWRTWTSRSAAPGTCSAPSSPGTWRRSATTPTCRCSRRRSRRCAETRARSRSIPRFGFPSTRGCRRNTCPR
jgi:transcription-repair coupling factor (superfamily II helicase)